MRRVVITGMAPVCSLGCDHEEVFQKLCEKQINRKEIERNTPARQKLKSRYCISAPVIENEEQYQKQFRILRARGGVATYWAAIAATLAMKDAKLEEADPDTHVFMGVGAPPMPDISDQILKLNETYKMDSAGIPKAMQSSTAAWISILQGTHGKSATISMACASGTETVGMGYESILNGKCDMALCGGSDALTDRNLTLLKGFEHLRAVTMDEDGFSLPFSQERSGFLFCEGAAAVVVLEELEHAKKRNAKIYAEIVGFESASDGFNIISMPKDGAIVKQMLKKLVKDKKVDYYNAHATGTVLNDAVESMVIQEIFGDRNQQPAISATKSLLGHTLGASGTLEVMVCADTIQQNRVHGSMTKTIMDNLNITSETRTLPVHCAVSASFGFGGHNAAIMLKKFQE